MRFDSATLVANTIISGSFEITGTTVPGDNSSYDLGTTSKLWRTVYSSALTGSLTKLSNGSDYLVAGSGIQLSTGSSGAVTITSAVAGSSLVAGSNTQVQFNNGGTFGADSNFTFNNVTDTLSVTNISGSLTRLTSGQPYLVGTGGVVITTGSSGAVTMSLATTSYTTASFTNATSVTVNHTVGTTIYDIEVFDTSYNKIIPGIATATSPTQANITFAIPTSGFIAVGGPTAGSSTGVSDLANLSTNISTTAQITGSLVYSRGLLTGSSLTVTNEITAASMNIAGGSQRPVTATTGTAPYYGARSWVNFNGKGTVSIRSSQNVSSITDNGVGDYTINFSVEMPDANYSIATGARQNSSVDGYVANTSVITPIVYSTTSIRMLTSNVAQALQDMEFLNVVTFR